MRTRSYKGENLYAVSVVLTKVIPDGNNIQNYLQVVEAGSEDEARGKVTEEAMKQNPEHQVFCVLALPVFL